MQSSIVSAVGSDGIEAGRANDEWTIFQLINLYALAVDARRWDLFDAIFTRNVQLEYPERAAWHDLATFKTEFSAAHAHVDVTQHIMHNQLIKVAIDEASAFTYCSFRLIALETRGGSWLEGTAWYDDLLVRTGGGWRIKRRCCRILWVDGNPAVTGAETHLPWDALRDEAAQHRIGYLNGIDARQSRLDPYSAAAEEKER